MQGLTYFKCYFIAINLYPYCQDLYPVANMISITITTARHDEREGCFVLRNSPCLRSTFKSFDCSSTVAEMIMFLAEKEVQGG